MGVKGAYFFPPVWGRMLCPQKKPRGLPILGFPNGSLRLRKEGPGLDLDHPPSLVPVLGPVWMMLAGVDEPGLHNTIRAGAGRNPNQVVKILWGVRKRPRTSPCHRPTVTSRNPLYSGTLARTPSRRSLTVPTRDGWGWMGGKGNAAPQPARRHVKNSNQCHYP